MSLRDGDPYDDSPDLIERIRKLREAAEKKMNAFGDPAEYDVRILRGQKKGAPAPEVDRNDEAQKNSQ
jgi:hypothetical protein